MWGVSKIFPGFMIVFGSNARFTSRKFSTNSDPNIFSVQKPRTIPSPCSPVIEPPNSFRRSDTSSLIL